jgi:hypothetical protein
MDHFREIKNTLTWHNEGKFEVVLINGIISKLNFCEPGKGPQDTGKCLNSTDYKFLKNVYTSLGELFAFIEEENKRLGYKYSQEEEGLPAYVPADEAPEEFPGTKKPKIRVLNSDIENNEADPHDIGLSA